MYNLYTSRELIRCYHNEQRLTQDSEGLADPCHGSLLRGRCLEIQ